MRKLFGNRVVVHLGKVLQHRDDYGARGAASLIKCEGGGRRSVLQIAKVYKTLLYHYD